LLSQRCAITAVFFDQAMGKKASRTQRDIQGRGGVPFAQNEAITP
jgi:hypothetical protein